MKVSVFQFLGYYTDLEQIFRRYLITLLMATLDNSFNFLLATGTGIVADTIKKWIAEIRVFRLPINKKSRTCVCAWVTYDPELAI